MELLVTGKLDNLPSKNDFQGVMKKINFSLPPSYVSFVSKYGAGLLYELFVIHVPSASNKYLDLEEGNRWFTMLIKDWIKEGWSLKFEPGKMYCFGGSENGDLLLWDISAPNSDNEFPIYLLGHEMEEEDLIFVANTVDEFVDFCTAKIDEVFPMGDNDKWNLPHTFQPY